MNKIAALLAMSCFATLSGLAWAAGEAPAQGGDFAGRMFREMDTNQDGIITKKEFEQYNDKRFDLIDTNHDGKITPEEIQAARKKLRQSLRRHFYQQFKRRFEAADTNHDGVLSREEAQSIPAVARHFDQIDSNHDGKVSSQEIGNYVTGLRDGR